MEGCRGPGMHQSRQIGVKPAAHVLYIKDKYIEMLCLFGGHAVPSRAIGGVNRQPGERVGEGIHRLSGLTVSPDAVLRREQS